MGLSHGSLLAWLILLLIHYRASSLSGCTGHSSLACCNGTEFQALLKNDTWQLVPPVSGVNVIDSKWVFKVKRHADGSTERYKA